AFGSGALFLLLAFPLARVFINDPESMGARPDGARPSAVEPSTRDVAAEAVSARRVLRSPEFWLISVGHSSALAIVGAVSVHFVLFVGSALEISVTAAAAMFTLIVVFQLVVQVSGGFLVS